ncbi:hypothetical protein [Streptomyces pseudogriseolus]|uniref:hypothetical protein n=1 Tax=Streptomyces pseudogriseolus TaxID=36817 RepID=UPI003FA1D7A2
MPLIALVVLGSSAFQVSVLAALSAVASAVIALPLGVRIEHQYKRPVMITADLARCLLLASMPVAIAFDKLTFTQLCVVGVLQTAAFVAFDAASGAHLKALILPEHRLRSNSLFETTKRQCRPARRRAPDRGTGRGGHNDGRCSVLPRIGCGHPTHPTA